MMTDKIAGIYQLPNGNWAYRFTMTVDGKRKNHKSVKDSEGKPLKTQRDALNARNMAMRIAEYKYKHGETEKKVRVTVQEIYGEYCEKGRSGKAYSTIKKQDSLWKNHIEPNFGFRFVDEISVAEVNDYLANLYYVEGRAYRYVEGFLKMFYLIFGQAYSRNYLDVDIYNKLCVNKTSKISMPKMKVDDDVDIVAFSREEIKMLDQYFKNSNAETAYLLGRCCGLRINECYGLKWENVNFQEGTIIIDRQMQYQDGIIKLVSLKTRNARRTLYMNQEIQDYLVKMKAKMDKETPQLKAQRNQNQTMIIDIDGKMISSLELVNCLPNGKIQTINSMKYHSCTVKEKLKIDFKYHYLRHTYGTRLAELNIPSHLLCNQMGHGNIQVTQQYYIAVSKSGIEMLRDKLNYL